MAHKGMVDKPRTARIVLKDFVKGVIVYCRAPPGVDQNEYHTVKAIKVCIFYLFVSIFKL